MAKVACYTPDGEMKMKEPIDARECVERLKFTMEPPCDDAPSEGQPVETKDEDTNDSKPKKKPTKKKKAK